MTFIFALFLAIRSIIFRLSWIQFWVLSETEKCNSTYVLRNGAVGQWFRSC